MQTIGGAPQGTVQPQSYATPSNVTEGTLPPEGYQPPQAASPTGIPEYGLGNVQPQPNLNTPVQNPNPYQFGDNLNLAGQAAMPNAHAPAPTPAPAPAPAPAPVQTPQAATPVQQAAPVLAPEIPVNEPNEPPAASASSQPSAPANNQPQWHDAWNAVVEIDPVSGGFKAKEGMEAIASQIIPQANAFREHQAQKAEELIATDWDARFAEVEERAYQRAMDAVESRQRNQQIQSAVQSFVDEHKDQFYTTDATTGQQVYTPLGLEVEQDLSAYAQQYQAIHGTEPSNWDKMQRAQQYVSLRAASSQQTPAPTAPPVSQMGAPPASPPLTQEQIAAPQQPTTHVSQAIQNANGQFYQPPTQDSPSSSMPFSHDALGASYAESLQRRSGVSPYSSTYSAG